MEDYKGERLSAGDHGREKSEIDTVRSTKSGNIEATLVKSERSCIRIVCNQIKRHPAVIIVGSSIALLLVAIALANISGDTSHGNEISYKLERSIKLTQTAEGYDNVVADANAKEKARTTNINTEGDWNKSKLKQRERIAKIQDELRTPLEEIGFQRSSKLLLELQELRGFHDLDSLLQMAECELQLGRGNEDVSIRRLRDFISSSESYSAYVVIGLASDFFENNSVVRALILYHICNDLFESHRVPPDAVVTWKAKIIGSVCAIAVDLINAGSRSREIGIKYGLKYAEKLFKEMRTIMNATPDKKALKEAWCLSTISSACNVALFYQKSIRYCKEGISILNDQFGVDASTQSAYGSLMSMLGIAYIISGQPSEAKRYCEIALRVFEKASDFENEKEKLEYIRRTREILKKI